jgi:AraC-like DNA-binding protein
VRAFVALFKAAALAFETRPPGFLTKLSELAYSILLFLGNELAGPRYPFPVQAALDYMHYHLNSQVSLRELSAAAHLSVPHFCRLFNVSMGSAPMEFFRRLKIGYARQHLTGTTARINEIAAKLGFEDVAYFSRVFTKETGVSPREFKRRELGENKR